MHKPEVLILSMRYLTADRSQSAVFDEPYWAEAELAYGFAQGDREHITDLLNPELSGEYVVAYPLRLGTFADQNEQGEAVRVPSVTIYFAAAELWLLMRPDAFPSKVRESVGLPSGSYLTESRQILRPRLG